MWPARLRIKLAKSLKIAYSEAELDASNSYDPDQDKLNFSWWVYREAGTYTGAISIPDSDKATTSFTIPSEASDEQIHVILEIHDLNPIASLYDYRRIVIAVKN